MISYTLNKFLTTFSHDYKLICECENGDISIVVHFVVHNYGYNEY